MHLLEKKTEDMHRDFRAHACISISVFLDSVNKDLRIKMLIVAFQNQGNMISYWYYIKGISYEPNGIRFGS